MDFNKCAACGVKFQKCPRILRQEYCSASKCQRERKRRWQRRKRKRDPAYKENQAQAQKAWSHRNKDYWRRYRSTHSEYSERNRAQQRDRNYKRNLNLLATIELPTESVPIRSGVYQLVPVTIKKIAKMDVWTVKIKFLSTSYKPKSKNCKERT